MIDIRRKTACPATVRRRSEAAIGLTLQQGLALQVVGNRYRPQHYRHAGALFRLPRLTAVELIQRDRLMHAAASQAEHASKQQNKWKAQKSHHPIQAATVRHRSDTREFIGRAATLAPQRGLSSAKSRCDSSLYT